MRLLLLAVVGLGVTAGFGVQPATAQAPAGDSVTGDASYTIGDPRFPMTRGFGFDARSGPSGENPTGSVHLTAFPEGVDITLPVTCLNVVDNRATIGTFASGFALFFFVEDNDGVGQDHVLWGFTPSASAPTACPATPDGVPFSFSESGTINTGDVVVIDAPSLPTSKDQCKNGGWRNFPGFKNQGDCVNFVETRGKNPPAQ